jgi:hypothetical protein
MPIALKLEAMATFVVRHATLQEYLDRSEIDSLMKRGFLKPAIHTTKVPVLFVVIPEFVASEASLILGEELMERSNQNAEDAAHWLVDITSHIPLGDIVAANAFLDAEQCGQGLSLDVVKTLINMPPQSTVPPSGMKFAMHVPSLGLVNMTYEEDGSLTCEIDGKRKSISIGPSDQPRIIADYHPWLILSHLAGMPMGYGPNDERLDHVLLGKIGSCQYVLRRPDVFLKVSGVLTHDIPGYGDIVCHKAGIIEPITYALFKMLTEEGPNQEKWIEKAVASGSLGLLARIDAVLCVIAKLPGPILQPWAERVLSEQIDPALRDALHARCSGDRKSVV